MNTYLLFIFVQFYCIYRYTSIAIKPELKRKILNFGYGISYKYKGMLAHSFERFYVEANLFYPLLEIWMFQN